MECGSASTKIILNLNFQNIVSSEISSAFLLVVLLVFMQNFFVSTIKMLSFSYSKYQEYQIQKPNETTVCSTVCSSEKRGYMLIAVTTVQGKKF